MNYAYVAGLFDGEGYVRIAQWSKPNSTHRRCQVYIGIGMSHKPVIAMLQKAFGGSLSVNDHSSRNPKHRPQFVWNCSSQIASKFLRKILPHLVVKREEALLALRLQESIDKYKFRLGNRFTKHIDHETIWAYRRELARQISELKHVRYSVSDDPMAQ